MTQINILNIYSKDLKKSTVLEPEVLNVLAIESKSIKLEKGENNSKYKKNLDLIIRSCYKLVIKIARHKCHNFEIINDLIQEGNLGIIIAIDLYDPKYNVNFINFACLKIKQQMNLYLIKYNSNVTLPPNLINDHLLLNKTKFLLEQEKGFYTDEDLTKRTNITLKNIMQCERAFIKDKSINTPINDDNDTTIADIIPSMDDNMKFIDIEHNKRKLKNLLSFIPERDRNIIMDYYGINLEYAKNIYDLSIKYKMTEANVCRIIESTIMCLQYIVNKK